MNYVPLPVSRVRSYGNGISDVSSSRPRRETPFWVELVLLRVFGNFTSLHSRSDLLKVNCLDLFEFYSCCRYEMDTRDPRSITEVCLQVNLGEYIGIVPLSYQ